MNIVAQNLGNYIHSLYMLYILNGIVNIISKKSMSDECFLDPLLAVRVAPLAYTSSGEGGSAARLKMGAKNLCMAHGVVLPESKV